MEKTKFSVIYINFGTLITQFNRAIRLMSRVFTNGPGDQGSIPGQVISKTEK